MISLKAENWVVGGFEQIEDALKQINILKKSGEISIMKAIDFLDHVSSVRGQHLNIVSPVHPKPSSYPPAGDETTSGTSLASRSIRRVDDLVESGKLGRGWV
jgi:hypothetical protein